MRKLYLLVLVQTLFFSQPSYAQDQVTFQGAIERGAFTLKTSEVSGLITFSSSSSGDSDIEMPFTIPAGHSKVAYQRTIPWSFADDGNGYISVDAICTTNCESSNVTTLKQHVLNANNRIELFGLDDRDDAYIVDIVLPKRLSYLTGRVELPEGMVASSDIEIDVFTVSSTGGNLTWSLYQFSNKVIIKSGENHANYSVPFRLGLSAGGVRLGYQCLSMACEQHNLTKQAWLGKKNNYGSLVMVTALRSSSTLYALFDERKDSFEINNSLAVEPDLTLFENIYLPIKVSIGNNKLPTSRIKGRVIVYKQEHKILCDYEYIWDGTDSCYVGSYIRVKEIFSETAFTINEGDFDTSINIKIEPLIQDSMMAKSYRQGVRYLVDSQYIGFVCDEGCDDFEPDQPGYYLGGTRTTSGLHEGGADQFFLTEEFYQNGIVIDLARVTAMPWVDYLLEDTATNTANIDE